MTAIGFPLTSLRLLDAEGAELAHVPLGEVAEPDLRYRCLRRGELNSALQQEVSARGIRLTHGARLTSVTDGPYGVTARFADGTTATGDLLIGADGLNSAVRRALSPGVRPGYAGQRVFYGRTPGAPGTGGSGVITMVRGSQSAFGYAEAPTGRRTGSPASAATRFPNGGRAHAAPYRARNCCPCCARTPHPPPRSWPAARAP